MKKAPLIILMLLAGTLSFGCKDEKQQIQEEVVTPPDGMVYIPAGSFMMGGKSEWAEPDEYPRRKVGVSAFFMDKSEVTNAEFAKFVEATGYVTTAERELDWEVMKQELAPNTPKPADSILQPGSLVFRPTDGPVDLIPEAGRGAMGIVYRATRDGADTPVAVKLLNPTIAGDPAMSARFVREGRAAALVNDTGVVGVTDFGTLPDGQGFLVMELVEGRTLEEVLEENGPLVPEEAVRITRRIAAALAAAHVRGVIHRDLKPSNVFVNAEGQIKIADFGAALVQDALRGAAAEASVILGTPAYMAPEQAQALPTDDRADVYSLGCILFRMLSGAPPFQGGAVLEVLQRHINEPAPRVSSPRGPLPESLVECVARALAKLPEDRFRSVSALKEALDQVHRELGGSDRIPRP